MVRPFPFFATLLTAISLAFYIIAASTAFWFDNPQAADRLVHYQANVQIYEGAYNACWRQHDQGIQECQHVNNDCTADFSAPVSTFLVTDSCSAWRVVRAFVVLAIITSAFALLALYLASFMKFPYQPLRAPALVLSFLAGLFGLISWATFISVSRGNTGYTETGSFATDDWQFGFSFALLTAAWVLNWLSLLFAAIPFPYAATAYDPARYLSAAHRAEASPEERERERAAALQEGGFGSGFFGLFGLSEEKRRGYAEKWRGHGSQAEKERQERRGQEGRAEASGEKATGSGLVSSMGGLYTPQRAASPQQRPYSGFSRAEEEAAMSTELPVQRRV